MNRYRREALKQMALQLDSLRDMLENVKDDMETIRDEEREAFDNLPASLQEGENGQAIDEAANNIGEAFDQLEDAVRTIGEAIGFLSTATGG